MLLLIKRHDDTPRVGAPMSHCEQDSGRNCECALGPSSPRPEHVKRLDAHRVVTTYTLRWRRTCPQHSQNTCRGWQPSEVSGQRNDPGNTAASISRAFHKRRHVGSLKLAQTPYLRFLQGKYWCDVRNHELVRNTDDEIFLEESKK